MVKNTWARSRPISDPYVTILSAGWSWKVLKAYQTRAGEKQNKYARLFCAVSSPMTAGLPPDLGDVYISDIPMTPEFVDALAKRLAEEVRA